MAPFPILVLLSAALALAATAASVAQPHPQAGPPTPDRPTGTPPSGGRSGTPAEPGTAPGGPDEGIGRGGVIKPPTDIDPGIHRAPPPVELPSRVIPPPGSPGGDPKVQPK
jgi:hypothetical protein